MKTLCATLLLTALAAHALALTKSSGGTQLPPPAQANNSYETLVAGVTAFGAQAFFQATRDPRAEQGWSFNGKTAIRILAPAVIGFCLGQFAGHFVQGSDRSGDDALASLAGSQLALSFKW